MDKKEFLEQVKEALQREEDLSESMALSDIEEWDSLAVLSMMSLFDQLFSVNVPIEQINKCSRVSDLMSLAGGMIK